MSDNRLPKKLLYGELSQGKRFQGGQKKRFKDSVKASLKAFDLDIQTWEEVAQNRGTWRTAIRKGAEAYEDSRIQAAEERRAARKNRSLSAATIPCPHCRRTFQARIGLTSHLRIHRNQPQPQDD